MSPAGLRRRGAAELHTAPRTLGAGTEQLGEPCGIGVTFAVPCHPFPLLDLFCLPRVSVQRKKKSRCNGWAPQRVCSWYVRKQKCGPSEVDLARSCRKRVHLGLPRGCVLLASPCVATPALHWHLPRVKRLNKNVFLLLSPVIFIAIKLSEV